MTEVEEVNGLYTLFVTWITDFDIFLKMSEKRSKKEKEIINELENHLRGKFYVADCWNESRFVCFCY